MKFRLACFASHLFISVLIALLSLVLVFKIWYPAPLDKALGVADIFILLLCIDVVLGPLLTLVVAKKGKKTLKTDLLVIAVLQLAALLYGLHIVAQGRPVWLVFDSNRIELVQAYEAVTSPNAQKPFQQLGFFTGPLWASVGEVTREQRRNQEVYAQAELLDAYSPERVSKVALPLKALKSVNLPEQLNAVLQYYPSADSFLPMGAKDFPVTLLVNKMSGEPIAIVDLRPW